MAYINKDQVKQIREALKKEFGGLYKFSVRMQHHSSVRVSIMKGSAFDIYETRDMRGEYYKVDLNDGKRLYRISEYNDCREYSEKDSKVFKKIFEIIKYGSDNKYFDKSDPMSDYFHTAFYYELTIGQYEKPFEVMAEKELKKVTKKKKADSPMDIPEEEKNRFNQIEPIVNKRGRKSNRVKKNSEKKELEYYIKRVSAIEI